jgi:uncharacterized YigZ family protein
MEIVRTVKDPVRVKVPVGACRFFGSVTAVANEAEAREFIEAVSAEFSDATHNAWGYKLGSGEGAEIRYSDDREPSGTAGPPIMQAIEGADVTNCVVVVTRYFGGVKLGVGGLIRAYRQAAAEALAEAGVTETEVRYGVRVTGLDYSALGTVLHELESQRAEIENVDYGVDVTIRARIFKEGFSSLAAKVRDLTRGQGGVEYEP